MQLYLVQHGEAASKEEHPDRPLTDKGISDVRMVLDALPSRLLPIDRILHSGKTRARQTAELIADRLAPPTGVGEADGLAPDADASIWRERLKGDDRTLMLVGHLPHLARLASLLLTGDPDASVLTFRPGGIVCLERGGQGDWSVCWMVIPELLVP